MTLLERTPLITALEGYAAEAAGVGGRFVLIGGEAGIGKTAGLEELRRRLPKARWLWGACDGLFTPRPLGPLFDIAGQIGGDYHARALRGASREEMFAGLTGFLAETTEPPVLVIEDVHWADEATLDLLRLLARRIHTSRALVLVTYREDEVGEQHRFRRVIGDLVTQRGFRRVGVPPLSLDAVRSLVDGADIDPVELHRITGGNPFYVTEAVASGLDSVPATVQDAVLARFSRLGDDARSVVEAAALIGSRIPAALLEKVINGAAGALDECVASGALVSDAGEYRFRHEITRLAVESSIPPHRAGQIHQRILDALSATAGADDGRLAYHGAGAGRTDVVLAHAPLAAAAAAALGAHREAADHYRLAVRFADGADDVRRQDLFESLGRQCYVTDEQEKSLSAHRAAIDIARARGDALGEGRNLRLVSRVLWRLCRGAESQRAIEDSLRVLETVAPSVDLAWSYAYAGAIECQNLEQSNALCERAVELAEKFGEPAAASYALNTLGCNLVSLGLDGWPSLNRALRIALDADASQEAARAFANMQTLATQTARPNEAERAFDEGLAYCDGADLETFNVCLWGWRSVELLLRGRFDEAVAVATESLKRRVVSPVNRITPLLTLGLAGARRGAPEAWDHLDEALGLAQGEDGTFVAIIRAARAEAKWLEGAHAEAAEEAGDLFDRTISADVWHAGEHAAWLARCGSERRPSGPFAGPWALEMEGKFEEAAAAWQASGRPYHAALALVSSGDETLLRRAYDQCTALGAPAAAAAIARTMRGLGIKAVPRGPRAATRTSRFNLTPRETEVLDLLVEGLTNAQISQRLFISPKTVDHHVSAVLTKLGARSRAEAARIAAAR